MNAQLHRALVAFTGMPDEPLRGCNGGCHQGDYACDCELSLDIAPDDKRVIQPPKRTPEDCAYLARVRRWTLLVVTTGMAALAGLLELFGASPLLP